MKQRICFFTVVFIFTQIVSYSQTLETFKGDNDKWGIKNNKGKIIVPARYDNLYKFFLNDNLFVAESNKKFTIIDKSQKEITTKHYDRIENFLIENDGLAGVTLDNKSGYIDKTGKEIIPLIYDYPSMFAGGYAVVSLNDKKGMLDKKGKIIVPTEYTDVLQYVNDNAIIVMLKDKFGIVDINGKVLIAPDKYDYIYNYSLNEKLFIAGSNARYGLIDKTGKEITSLKYDTIDNFFSTKSNILVPVRLNSKWGFIDSSGKERVVPFYDNIYGYSTIDIISVKKDSKFGFIDKYGKETVPLIYERLTPYNINWTIAVKDKNIGMIDDQNNIRIPFEYEDMNSFYGDTTLLIVKMNKKWGAVDNTSKLLIPFIYDDFSFFVGGKARVKKGNEQFDIDRQGNRIK